MHIWLILIGASALTGLLVAIFVKKPWAIYLAGGIPWFGLLAAILYTEYLTPHQGGGASMWPIAQLFGGAIAAVSGIAAYNITRNFIIKIANTHNLINTIFTIFE